MQCLLGAVYRRPVHLLKSKFLAKKNYFRPIVAKPLFTTGWSAKTNNTLLSLKNSLFFKHFQIKIEAAAVSTLKQMQNDPEKDQVRSLGSFRGLSHSKLALRNLFVTHEQQHYLAHLN
jgi:hypothetical protein